MMLSHVCWRRRKKLLTELVKTLQLFFRPLTKRKRGELDRVLKEFCWIANEVAKRLPSVPKYNIKKKRFGTWNEWYKEFRETVDLHSQCALEAVHKARESYVSMHSNKVWNKIPVFKGNVARFHNQSFEFFEKNGTYYLSLPVRGGRKNNRVFLPLETGLYERKFLGKILRGELEHGSGELKKHNGSYVFNLTLKEKVEVRDAGDYVTVIGVDMGLNNVATMAVLLPDGKVTGVKLWSGRYVGLKREKFYRLRKELSKKGLVRKIRKTKGREAKFVENVNHNISRAIVDKALEYEKPVIVMEELKNIRERVRKEKKGKKFNRMLNSWTFAKLQEFIEYKAKLAGIPVVKISPRNTSRTCNKCGEAAYTKRYGKHKELFECFNCGLKDYNADVNAAINIAKSYRNAKTTEATTQKNRGVGVLVENHVDIRTQHRSLKKSCHSGHW